MAAERQPDRFFLLYRALGKVDIGAPVSVKVRSCAINIDYLLSVQEYLFLESAADLATTRSIVEIGAGFGRTCHAMLALVAGIERYTIVDLPNVLELSRRVLSLAVPQHFHKLRFLDAADTEAWRGLTADLAINIDSFQEMPPATIDTYMKGLVAQCGRFYVKNPIAKYDPACIGIAVEDPARFLDVFSLGYCREVIDIFDDEALEVCRRKYVEAYRPGSSWTVVAERPADLFSYYHHVLYRSA
ncbi:MAG: putative sugar O-methyltransferase [Xanthobacteraceae bacterium]